MEQGDHIDPATGARLIALPLPHWFGQARRARLSVLAAPADLVAAPLVEEPASYQPYRWAWTENGYRQVACE